MPKFSPIRCAKNYVGDQKLFLTTKKIKIYKMKKSSYFHPVHVRRVRLRLQLCGMDQPAATPFAHSAAQIHREAE
jgi:hypothetical protein